jgi:prepilin-type N-terminal cleavage/methylation domain-containing protein
MAHTRRGNRRGKGRRGVTLIELLVTIAILSVVLTITTLSLAGEKRPAETTLPISARIHALRSKAVESGRPQTMVLSDTDGTVLVTALPDGRVVSEMPNLDRNAGFVRVVHAR